MNVALEVSTRAVGGSLDMVKRTLELDVDLLIALEISYWERLKQRSTTRRSPRGLAK